MVYGYARVSTTTQGRDGNSLEAQRRELQANGAQTVYSDTFTGTRADRPQLMELLPLLSPGDTLMVTKIDRLGRSVVQVNEIIEDLIQKNVRVHVLNMGVMDSSATGQLIRTIMLAFAQFERDMILERTKEGKEIARQRPGYKEGRRPKYTETEMQQALDLLSTHSYAEVVRMTGISKSTLIRYKAMRLASDRPCAEADPAAVRTRSDLQAIDRNNCIHDQQNNNEGPEPGGL